MISLHQLRAPSIPKAVFLQESASPTKPQLTEGRIEGLRVYQNQEGVKFLSVTSFLRLMSGEVSNLEENPWIKDALTYGTMLHKVMEAFLKNETVDETGFSRGTKNMLRSSCAHLIEMVGSVVAQEIQVCSPKYHLAGTFDALIREKMSGKLTLLDFKTTASETYAQQSLKKYTAQMNLYAIMLGESGLNVEAAKLIFLDKGKEISYVFDVPLEPQVYVAMLLEAQPKVEHFLNLKG